jgi:hypothetical protein
MKINPTNNKKNNISSAPTKAPSSLPAKIEQIAKLLREQVKPNSIKPRKATVLSSTNTIEQVAKLLRSEIHKKLKRIAKKK